MIPVIFALLVHTAIGSSCPEDVNLDPCECSHTGQGGSRLLCRGAIGLPRLTGLLQNDLCGRHIDKFELVNSDIKYLPSNLFDKIRVEDIQISYTNISHFTRAGRSAFYGLEPHLKSLSMRYCNLVDNLEWQMIGDLRILVYLDLSFNDLTRVPQEWFKHPPFNLKSLFLKGNRIRYLESGALALFYQLVELDLSQNEISVVKRDALPNPGNSLIFLRLGYNNIADLPEDFFHELYGIRRLYLNNNKIETLPEKVWNTIWGELLTLDLLSNELRCDCDMEWVTRLYSPGHLYAECDLSNNSTAGKTLKSLKPKHFKFCSI